MKGLETCIADMCDEVGWKVEGMEARRGSLLRAEWKKGAFNVI